MWLPIRKCRNKYTNDLTIEIFIRLEFAEWFVNVLFVCCDNLDVSDVHTHNTKVLKIKKKKIVHNWLAHLPTLCIWNSNVPDLYSSYEIITTINFFIHLRCTFAIKFFIHFFIFRILFNEMWRKWRLIYYCNTPPPAHELRLLSVQFIQLWLHDSMNL